MEYFIVENGQQAGPYTINELISRGLNSDTLVWAEGMTDWTPAWQVEELKAYLYGNQQTASTTPPPPPVGPAPRPASPQQPVAEPAPVQPKKKRGSSHIGLWIGMAIILFAAILLGVTCPEREQHQQTLRANISSALTSTLSDALPVPKQLKELTGAFGENVAYHVLEKVVDPLLDDVLVYHNYIFFSTTTVEFGGKTHTTSVGLLGKVFTMSEADICNSACTRLVP